MPTTELARRPEAGLARIPRIAVAEDDIVAFCERWDIDEMAVFGSVLRDDFGPDSDVNLLVTFSPNAYQKYSYFDLFEMEREIGDMLARRASISTRYAIECDDNDLRRKEILESAEVIYEARRKALAA